MQALTRKFLSFSVSRDLAHRWNTYQARLKSVSPEKDAAPALESFLDALTQGSDSPDRKASKVLRNPAEVCDGLLTAVSHLVPSPEASELLCKVLSAIDLLSTEFWGFFDQKALVAQLTSVLEVVADPAARTFSLHILKRLTLNGECSQAKSQALKELLALTLSMDLALAKAAAQTLGEVLKEPTVRCHMKHGEGFALDESSCTEGSSERSDTSKNSTEPILVIVQALQQPLTVELLGVLEALLCQHPANCIEFKECGGYALVKQGLTSIQDSSQFRVATSSLGRIACNGSDCLVNQEALCCLLELLQHPTHSSIVVETVHFLVRQNWRNVLVILSERCFDLLEQAFQPTRPFLELLRSMNQCSFNNAACNRKLLGLFCKAGVSVRTAIVLQEAVRDTVHSAALQHEFILGQFPAFKVMARAATECLDRRVLGLVDALLMWEFRYTESYYTVSKREARTDTLFEPALIEKLAALKEWELVMKAVSLYHGYFNCAHWLQELCNCGYTKQVIEALLLEDYPSFSHAERASRAQAFLTHGEVFKALSDLPLLVAACTGSRILKLRAASLVPESVLGQLLPLTEFGLFLLLSLVTEADYYLVESSTLHGEATPSLSHRRCLLLDTPYLRLFSRFAQCHAFKATCVGFVESILGDCENQEVFAKHDMGRILLEAGVSSTVLHNLFTYSVTPKIMRRLIDQGEYDSLTQLLDDTGKAAQFVALTNETLQSAAVTQLPAAGLTLMFWVKGFQEGSLFKWVNKDKGVVCFELAYSPPNTLRVHLPNARQCIFRDRFETAKWETADQWSHFAFVHGKTSFALYVNGSLVLTTSAPSFDREGLSLTAVFGNETSSCWLAGIQLVAGKAEGIDKIWESDPSTLHSPGLLSLCDPCLRENPRAALLNNYEALLGKAVNARAMSALIKSVCRSPENAEEFEHAGGWQRLYHTLTELPGNECLLEGLVDMPIAECHFRNMLVIQPTSIPLIPADRLELLELLTLEHFACPTQFLRNLAVLMHRKENVERLLAKHNGIDCLLLMFKRTADVKAQKHLLALFEKVLYAVNKEQLAKVMDFLTISSVSKATAVQLLTLIAIHTRLATNSFAEYFLQTDSHLLLFYLLASPCAAVAAAALRLIGVLLTQSDKAKSFQDTLTMPAIAAQIHSSSKELYAALLGLATEDFASVKRLYPPNAGVIKTILNESPIAHRVIPAKSSGEKLVRNPGALQVLINRLVVEPDVSLTEVVLRKVNKLLLTPENCKTLVNSPFITWCVRLPASPELRRLTDTLAFFSLNLSSSPLFTWFAHTPDLDSTGLVNDVLEWLESNPDLGASSKKIVHSHTFLKNLYGVLPAESSFEQNTRLMQLINLLVSVNSPQVRAQMKALHYFEKRDDLLIQTLKEDLSESQLRVLFQEYSFSSIASQKRFKHSFAIYYCIKHLSEASHSLQELILNVLWEDVFIHKENRAFLRKLFKNQQFVQSLIGKSYPEDQNGFYCCFSSAKRTPLEVPENFLEWFNALENKQAFVFENNQQYLSAYITEYRKARVRAQEAKARKQAKAAEHNAKATAAVQLIVADINKLAHTRHVKATQRFSLS